MDFLGVDIRSIILAVIAVANLILAASVYLSSKEKSSLFFALTIMSVVVWSVGINLYIQPGVTNLTYLVSKINYIAAVFISVFFFYFAYLFKTEERVIPKKFFWLSGMSISLLIFLIISPGMENGLIVSEITEKGAAKLETFGSLYPLFVLTIAVYFFSGLGTLIFKYRKNVGAVSKQLRYIILGTGVSILLGITTNIALPNLGIYGFDWLGPAGTFIMIGFTFIAIRVHGLWDLKLVAIEMFIGLIGITLILQIMVEESTLNRTVNGIIFGIVLIFSYFLIRNLLREREVREQMERLAANLADANAKLKEIDIEKSDFVSITSHQFRTPLTIIKGYTSMLLEGSFGIIRDKTQYRVIKQMFRASQRLVLIIDEYLNVSRIEKKEMRYNFKLLDLRKEVEEAIEHFKITIQEENMRFAFNTDISDTFIVRADKIKIQQVFRNIIDNAIKYTQPGGSITITLARAEKEGLICFSVKDDGIGMQKEIMDRLFEKFSRAKGVSKLHTEGRGLGLYIARQMVEAHGGRIWAESEGKNKGSTFHVEFIDPEIDMKRKEVKQFVGEI